MTADAREPMKNREIAEKIVDPMSRAHGPYDLLRNRIEAALDAKDANVSALVKAAREARDVIRFMYDHAHEPSRVNGLYDNLGAEQGRHEWAERAEAAEAAHALLSSENEKLAGMVKLVNTDLTDFKMAWDRVRALLGPDCPMDVNEVEKRMKAKDAELQERDATIREQNATIASLRAELAKEREGYNCGPEHIADLRIAAERAEANKLRAALTHHREAAKALADYATHEERCVRRTRHAGEPTPDGGYREKFGDKWYQSRPVDETPKCDCGLDEAYALYEAALTAPPSPRGGKAPVIEIQVLERRTRPRDVPLSCRLRLCRPERGTCPTCQRVFFKDDVQVKILPAEARL